MKKRILAVLAAAVLAVTLTACGRSIDIEATGAKSVPGANGLYYLCHGPTLVYVSIWEHQADEYEAMWPGWCVLLPDGTWAYPVDRPELFPAVPAAGEGNTEGEN